MSMAKTAKITIETPNGDKSDFMYANGITLPWKYRERFPGKNLAKHIQEIQVLDIRDDDVYLTAFPKCGTHWIWEIILMLQKGKAEYETSTKEALFLDFNEASIIDTKPSPRVLNGHYPCRLTPKGMFEKRTKIIHVMRNPKDAFVSMYYHQKTTSSEQDFVKDFQTFLPYIRGDYGISFFGPFFEHVTEWEKFTRDHPEQILNLFFEDVKEDPVREIKKIDKFLGTDRNDKLFEQIAEACDFQNLKKADAEIKIKEKFMPKDTPTKKVPPFMYRKGDVGDWKNHFTDSMNEETDKWIKEKSRGSELAFRYTL